MCCQLPSATPLDPAAGYLEVLPRFENYQRGELELPKAVNMLIKAGFSACGFLQLARAEWSPGMDENLEGA